MRIIKSLVPIFLLIIFSFYSYQHYIQLPKPVLNGVIFLPVLLALLVIGLTIHFNRSQIFFYAILIILANAILGLEIARTPLSYALFSSFIPLLLLTMTLLPDRGIFSFRAIINYAVLGITLLISLVIHGTSPDWVTYLLLTDWLPARYFDWTQQPQTVLMISVLSFISMLILTFLKPSTYMAAGLGIFIMLVIQLHFGGVDRSLNVFSSVALIMCLYTLLQDFWRMAFLDELTELPARRALREKLQMIGRTYAIAMLDVDHFKKFNDTYGHDTGDAVLRMIAAKLKQVTGNGTAYRYGGEEFAIVFPGKNCSSATSHLETLRETIAQTLFVIDRESRRGSNSKPPNRNNKSVNVTVSIGIADSHEKTVKPWDVLKLADSALYRAKKKGRNCVCS